MLKLFINEVLEKIDNRYYLVGIVLKRVRKLIDGEELYVLNKIKEKFVCVVIKEVVSGKIIYRLLIEEEIEIEEVRYYVE